MATTPANITKSQRWGAPLDPFADKVIVCGTFIFIAVAPGMLAEPRVAGMDGGGDRRPRIAGDGPAQLSRRRGSDFSANMSGKLKMVLQSVAAAASLVFLNCRGSISRDMPMGSPVPGWVYWTTISSIWSAVILTVYSGAIYVWIAYRLSGRTPTSRTHDSAASDIVEPGVEASRDPCRLPGRRAPIWLWISLRLRRGEPIIPLARRRPVPWQGQDVLFIFFIGFLLPILSATAVRPWVGNSGEQKEGDRKPDLSHPAEQMLRSRDSFAIAAAVTMAVIVPRWPRNSSFASCCKAGWKPSGVASGAGRPELRKAAAVMDSDSLAGSAFLP